MLWSIIKDYCESDNVNLIEKIIVCYFLYPKDSSPENENLLLKLAKDKVSMVRICLAQSLSLLWDEFEKLTSN